MLRNTRADGLTLVELLVTFAVLAIVSALALPIVMANISLVSQESTNRTLTEITNFVRDWDRADGTISVVDGRLQSNYNGMDVENIRLPEGFMLVGTGTASDPYSIASVTGDRAVTPTPDPSAPVTDSSSSPTSDPTPTSPPLTTEPVIVPDGTLTQPSTVEATTGTIGDGLTFVRNGDKLILQSPRANWEKLEVTYTRSSTETVALLKRAANGTVAGGILLKVSNTEVHVLLPASQTFTLFVAYNGGSTGYFFFL